MATAAARRSGRLRLLGWAYRCVAADLIAMLLYGLLLLSLALVPIGLGLLGVLALIPAIRRLTGWQRRGAGQLLGREIASPYRPASGRGVLATLGRYGRDPATWRDVGWLLCGPAVGAVTSTLHTGLFVGGLFYLIYPVTWSATGGAVRFVGVVEVQSLGAAIVVGLLAAAVLFALWFLVGGRLLHARARVDAALLAPTRATVLSQRVQQLSRSRADTVDTQAAELRRIERDLHDGAQARLVSLGISLGLAEELAAGDPDQMRSLLAEARAESSEALAELRDLVRGIHPPVLADRGLPGALHALALNNPLEVEVDIELPGRPSAPVESAVYFAVSELLTNAAKHSGADRGWLRVRHRDGWLAAEVGDHGRGGATPTETGGLRGVERRLAAFDGRIEVTSPPGGPTVVIMEVPCALSSPRTTPSSETD